MRDDVASDRVPVVQPGEAPTVADLLRTHRLAAGLTQRELARSADLSVAAIRDLEQGRSVRPRGRSVHAIAEALGLDAAALKQLRGAVVDSAHRNDPPGLMLSAPLHLRVLGPLELWRRGRRISVRSPTQRLLLAALALNAPRATGTKRLAELIWGLDLPPNSAKSLQAHITRLRRTIGPEVLVSAPMGYRLRLEADQTDLSRFRRLSQEADAGEGDSLDLLSEAVELWRGGCPVEELRDDPVVTGVAEEYVAALRQLGTVAAEAGEPERPLQRMRELAEELELHEPLHAALVITLATSGRQAEALAAYERVRRSLADQLGLDPGEQLREAHLGVLQQRWRPDTVAARRMILQVPAAPSAFIGREEQLAHVESELARSEPAGDGESSRTVFVHGTTGAGKTAFVHVASHRLRSRYPDGQLYADLGGSSSEPVSPLLVLARFLRALGVASHRITNDLAEAAAEFRTELAERRMLVVLDNAQSETQVRPLLPGAGQSDVLITSRRVMRGLHVAASISLGTLTLQESFDLLEAVAGRDRVLRESAAAREVATACGRLPLALRIAGARLASRPSWTVGDLLHRLRDEGERLRQLNDGETSVLAGFRLSHDNLSEQARHAFRLCALHPAEDFGVPSTAALLGTDVASAEILLDELTDANMLLQYSAHRFRFHDLLRLYARQLADDIAGPEFESTLSRYRAWYLDHMSAAIEWVYPQAIRLSGHEAKETVFADRERALSWLDQEATAVVELAERAACDPHADGFSWRASDQMRHYFLALRQTEGWRRLVAAGLTAAELGGDGRALATTRMGRAQVQSMMGDDNGALEDALAALDQAEACGWTAGAAYLSHNIGWQYYELGDLASADSWFTRALELSQEDSSGHVHAAALNGQGMVLLDRGLPADAQDSLSRALTINEAAGRDTSALTNRGNLARAFRQLGLLEQAEECLSITLQSYRSRLERRGELSTLDEMSQFAVDHDNPAEAVLLAHRADSIARHLHDARAQVMTACTLGEALQADGAPHAARKVLVSCTERADTHGYRFLEARARIGLARSWAGTGNPDVAISEATKARSLARERGFRLLEEEAGKLISNLRAP